MDTDGDATVDFHEFCIGMTGRAKGPFDGLSEWDVNRLIETFLEYASTSKRMVYINSIESASSDANDSDCLQYFKNLYADTRPQEQQKSTREKLEAAMNADVVDPELIAIKRQIAAEKR
jgi:hypothetical protein